VHEAEVDDICAKHCESKQFQRFRSPGGQVNLYEDHLNQKITRLQQKLKEIDNQLD